MAFLDPLPGTGGGDRDHHCRDLRQGLQLIEPSEVEAGSLEEAAAICSEIARQELGRYAHALDLLPAGERARAECLAALARGLLDFAREKGFGGERLAKVLLLQDRLEDALEEGRSDEPVFAAFAGQNREQPWNRSALEGLQAMIRSLALTQEDPSPERLSESLLILMLGKEAGPASIGFLASLLRGEPDRAAASAAERELPRSWQDALRYARLAAGGSEPGRFRRSLIRIRIKKRAVASTAPTSREDSELSKGPPGDPLGT